MCPTKREGVRTWSPVEPHILRSVGEDVGCPSHQLLIHPYVLHLPPQQQRLDSVEGTGEFNKRDSHSAPRGLQVTQAPVQQVHDRIIPPKARSIRKLQRVHLGAEVGKDDPLQTHQGRGQGHRSVVARVPWGELSWGPEPHMMSSTGLEPSPGEGPG